jgi:hypothetical protein
MQQQVTQRLSLLVPNITVAVLGIIGLSILVTVSIFQPLVVVCLWVGSAILWFALRYTNTILLWVFTLLPFYPLTIFAIERQLGLSTTQALIVRAFRDLFFILVFLWTFKLRGRLSSRLHVLDFWVLSLLSFNLLYLVWGDVPIAVRALSIRENYVYFLGYFIGRLCHFSFAHFRHLLRNLVVVSVILSVFALVQAYILGPTFLIRFRDIDVIFVSAFGFYGIQRAVGTFAHAPELAGFLLISCAITLWFLQQHSRRLWLWGILLLFLVTIAATFTRSVWIGMIVMLATILRSPRYIKMLIPIILVAIISILVTPVSAYIKASFSLDDPSALYHYRVLEDSLKYLLHNPLGTGLGSVGVASVRNLQSSVFFEGFFFNLAGEIGWLGLLLYWIVLGRAFISLLHVGQRSPILPMRQWARVLQGALLGIAVTGFFLPLMVSREIAFTLWFLIGVTVSLNQFLRSTHTELSSNLCSQL